MRSKDRLTELKLAAAAASGGVYAPTVEPAPAALPPDLLHTFQEAERIRGWIHDLNANTQLLRRLVTDPTFHANQQLQDHSESIISESNSVGVKVCGALRQLEGSARRARGGGVGGGGAGGAAARIVRLQYAASRALYGEALGAHHAALAALRDRRLLLLRGQIALTNLTISDEECENLLESKNLSLFVDNVEAETAEARRTLREVEARHEELARAERSLRDVRDLFHQLAHLVAAQQEQVDSVEYYALQASEHVECGGQQLLKGTVSRTKTRKKKLSLIVCLAVGFFVVLLVLVCT